MQEPKLTVDDLSPEQREALALVIDDLHVADVAVSKAEYAKAIEYGMSHGMTTAQAEAAAAKIRARTFLQQNAARADDAGQATGRLSRDVRRGAWLKTAPVVRASKMERRTARRAIFGR